MTTREIAEAFAALCKAGQHQEAGLRFWSDDIVSREAMDGPMAELRGRDAVKAKSDWWEANHEVHGGSTEGPFVNGDGFALIFELDVTAKQTGQRMQMKEVALYTVRDGKVVEERFFY
ncbi:nuclear transport factor 2 family protein [Falsiroseomonas oryzae]|uniref:nuclear transport factor 2 family protein n=1 Tax=Falsiroseomonas oryzae TaxID=2766473 RepID=UPI0022EA439C|nr:nuclear transport factor 2 family protein [Roseomonas sp. MO-31]